MGDTNYPEDKNISFEDFKNENGITFWWASDLMRMMGYQNMKSFQGVLDRTTKAFVSLDIPHYENIIHEQRPDDDGVQSPDFKMTRFACYLTVMNGDPGKKSVAEAQAYFAQLTRRFELHLQDGDQLDRLMIRDEIKEGTKSLNSTAKEAGVTNYARFTNSGYLGMYNMSSWELENKRSIKKGKLFDNMGRAEMAANLFRITQTEERIKSRAVKGQENLEKTHRKVGKEVRDIIIENSGRAPEYLPQEKQLPDVKKELKKGYKNMASEDNKKDKGE